ncbi:4Fe-4S dicluster domain-containing protein [Pontibaca methylaminivorans]|uniref:Prokaryotic molybdopterin-containing oxidoreductase family, iron-sulfur binding subunit n=1 Tax=Pontibaca methylaminivorans TaxID=515897 RepID=A0A1R3XAQ3_9RHOB|nr:4Fe-4S dicluster domain-containing protein [Pontibaca methylaminivorans]SIT86609.1 prokaryotic molybdopterin-containing oxidoreductase family, iron-sulfur binding subunit [Pontibaca methylaminivorans]
MSGGVTRRGALRLFSAGAAALIARSRPAGGASLPYRAMPEGLVPGRPVFFATSLPLGGAGRGVLVETHEGRPTKIHGNPDHPASGGASDVFAEAAVLDLFDPHRSRAPRRDGIPAGWPALEAALAGAGRGQQGGLALLTGPVGSPTLARQLRAVPGAVGAEWFMSQPLRPALADARAQFWPDFPGSGMVVSLGADPLGPGPAQLALARAWTMARRAGMRSACFEAQPTLTGAASDRRFAVRPSVLAQVAAALAGDAVPKADLPQETQAIARSLHEAGGLVLPGPDLPAQAQAQVAALNERLGSRLRRLRPFWDWPGLDPGSVDDLVAAMERGDIRGLIVIGCNPVYEYGPGFAELMRSLPESFHFGTQIDETAEAARWHGPLHHPLEDWSDLRAVEGTIGLQQPVIAPLHDSRSAHQVLGMVAGDPPGDALGAVQATWRARWEAEFDERWPQALHDGVVGGTGPEQIASPVTPPVTPAAPPPAATGPPARGDGDSGLEVALLPSPTLWDGSFAGNAWLQECPDPFSKQVWGNAIRLAPSDAARLDIKTGDAVELAGRRRVTGPALVSDLQAAGSVGLHRGHGREAAGPIGTGIGFRATGLGPRAELRRADAPVTLLRMQSDFDQQGRDFAQVVPARQGRAESVGDIPASLYPDRPGAEDPARAWGMVIDTDACIGCNACVIACQAENNIPVVGAAEVARGRRMHWLRIDRYEAPEGAPEGAQLFQPVPCMHCEKAPCEPVCPVAASVHDSEGLNLQVYNRCIGTRFCQANCPYKVRRFNFFDYAGGQTVEEQGSDLLAALRNPDVSVRARGVMEKCTYCVQRISAARINARKEQRAIRDGEVVTACQAACPTGAISFGDLLDPGSRVRRQRQDPRHYALLGHLGTRPRTTYLARVIPPHDEAPESQPDPETDLQADPQPDPGEEPT